MLRILLTTSVLLSFTSIGFAQSIMSNGSGTAKIITIPDSSEPETDKGDTVVTGLRDSASFTSLLIEIGDDADRDGVRVFLAGASPKTEGCSSPVFRDRSFIENRTKTFVCYDDLAPISEETAELVYQRIKRASKRACPSLGKAPLAAVKACRSDAVEQAVFQINDPLLLSVYAIENGVSANTVPVGQPQPF